MIFPSLNSHNPNPLFISQSKEYISTTILHSKSLIGKLKTSVKVNQDNWSTTRLRWLT